MYIYIFEIYLVPFLGTGGGGSSHMMVSVQFGQSVGRVYVPLRYSHSMSICLSTGSARLSFSKKKSGGHSYLNQ